MKTMMSLEKAIEQYEKFANICEYHNLTESQEEFEQLAAWLRELKERRKEPEIIRCAECTHRSTHNCVANVWVSVFGYTVNDDFYCGLAERRTDGENLSE